MRNATELDAKNARAGDVPYGVMFSSANGPVHRKPLANTCGLRRDGLVLMEHATKDLSYIFHPDNLYAIVKGPSQQPKKPRRKPVKGTKPEQFIQMSADVKLKVGDKVLLRNGTRACIEIVDNTQEPYFIAGHGWYKVNGKIHSQGSISGDITHKIVPWEEQSHLYIGGKLAGTVANLKHTPQKKSPEQEAFEKGYWVAHIATQHSRCHAFAEDHKIDFLMRWCMSERAEYAQNLCWTEIGGGAQIIAYRKAKQ